MGELRAVYLRNVPSPEGEQADLLIIEPNGDEHQVRCLCRTDGGTDLSELGDGKFIPYLADRYGSQVIWALTRQVTLTG